MTNIQALLSIDYIDAMINVLWFLSLIAFCFFGGIGILTFIHLFSGAKPPADTSNRINRIRLWWFALTRPDKFVDTFPWLKNDEWENVNPEPFPNYGLLRYPDSTFSPPNILSDIGEVKTIVVTTPLAKEQLLRASKYIHSRKDLNTDLIFVNNLALIHHNPDMVIVEKKEST